MIFIEIDCFKATYQHEKIKKKKKWERKSINAILKLNT